MNVAKMRLLDRWLGVPTCWLLTLWRSLFGRRPPGPPFAPRKILFVKLAEQGSTVLAQSALHAAIRRVGRENVYFLLFAENRPILDFLDLVPAENIIAIDARGLPRVVWSALGAVWRLRKLGIDAALDLEFFARASAALTYLSGAPWRVGFHGFNGEAAYRGNLMTHRLSFNPYLHTSQTFQTLVDALDQPPDRLPTFDCEPPALPEGEVNFQPTPEERADVAAIVADQLGTAQSRRLVLLNANASDLIPLRRWSRERYVELARRLLAEHPDVAIAFTGAPAEAQPVEDLVKQIDSPRCVSLAGRTTLRQLMVLYCLAEVLVTNDSGPAHFASLTPIDVVVLFGPETPRLFAAVSPRSHPLWAGLTCSPCINAFNDRLSPCRDNVCMQRITVDQVFNQVRDLLERRNAHPFRPVSLPLTRSA